MAKIADVRVRRIYEAQTPHDGTRVLVDRLWPRGISKKAASWDEWARDVAPSDALRRWYGHDPAKFAEFRRRYLAELDDTGREAAWHRPADQAATGTVTLLTATKDVDHSEAAVLAERLTAP